MTFQFDIGDRLRLVEVQRAAPGHRVIVDGRLHVVEAVRVEPLVWSLIVNDETGRRRSVEAVVAPRNGDGTIDVHIGRTRIAVHWRSGLGRRSRGARSASGAGPQRVVAPMPGKVVRVLVKPGDPVQVRQGLVVVEAMKMENELRAVRSGRVREVFVTEGQSVDAGTALVVVDEQAC